MARHNCRGLAAVLARYAKVDAAYDFGPGGGHRVVANRTLRRCEFLDERRSAISSAADRTGSPRRLANIHTYRFRHQRFERLSLVFPARLRMDKSFTSSSYQYLRGWTCYNCQCCRPYLEASGAFKYQSRNFLANQIQSTGRVSLRDSECRCRS
jgi:hypothetical protein